MSDVPRKAMLLAAGEGTRLRPLTARMPKCMVPVGGKPVLEHNIIWLRDFGVSEFILNLFYMPDAVRSYFGDGSRWDVSIEYSIEENLLGTAGGVKKVEHFFDGPFILWYGDNLSNIDLRQMAAFHREKAGTASIALFYREDPTASGIVGLDNDQRIGRFLEKPAPEEVFSHWVSAGIFFLEQAVLDYIPHGISSDFGHDILPEMLAQGEPMFGYQLQGQQGLWWIDTLADLQRLQQLHKEEAKGS